MYYNNLQLWFALRTTFSILRNKACIAGSTLILLLLQILLYGLSLYRQFL